jgi:hypothetical protein
MLDHKNIQSTQHYAKIVDEKVGTDMELLALRLEAKMNWQSTNVTLIKSPIMVSNRGFISTLMVSKKK